MSQSPECAAVEKCSDVGIKLLSSGVVSLDIFGQQLVSADFIANEALRNILDTMGSTPTTKARKLLDSVHAQVKVNKEKFKLFLSILENTPTLNSFLDKINAEYELHLRAESHRKSPKVLSHLAKKGSAELEAGKMSYDMQDKLPALRNLMRVNRYIYDDYGADEATFITTEEFMGTFFQTVSQLWSMIAEIISNVHETKEYYSLILKRVDNQGIKKEADKLTVEIKQLSRCIHKDLKTLKEEVDKAPDRNTADFRMKNTQFTTLSRKLHDVMSEYSQVKSEYRDKCKDRIQRLLKYTGKQVTEDEMEEMLESDNPAVFTQDILIDTAQTRQVLGEIEARHHEIIELEINIKELHEMFYDLALLVEEQGDIINRIEYNVEMAAVHVDVARKDVRVAAPYHKKNTRLRWCICGIVTCSIIALLIAIAIIVAVVVSMLD